MQEQEYSARQWEPYRARYRQPAGFVVVVLFAVCTASFVLANTVSTQTPCFRQVTVQHLSTDR